MRAIKYLLFGIGILLFCICLYIWGIFTKAPTYAGAAYYLQYVGLIFLIIGFFQKPKDDENHN